MKRKKQDLTIDNNTKLLHEWSVVKFEYYIDELVERSQSNLMNLTSDVLKEVAGAYSEYSKQLYYMENFNPLFIYDGNFLVFTIEMYTTEQSVVDLMKSSIKHRQKYIKAEKTYYDKACVGLTLASTDIHKLFLLNCILEKYGRYMTKSEKRSLVLEVYTTSNFNFDKELFNDILTNTVKGAEDIKNLITYTKENNMLDNEGYLEIYRGENPFSRGINEALSWTVDYSVATYFMNRWNTTDGEPDTETVRRIWRAKIKPEDVLASVVESGEQEVLVQEHNLVDVEIVEEYYM